MELKTLCELQGPSGREEQVRSAVLSACQKIKGVTAEIDTMGNVLATRKGTAKKPRHVMLSAHMDEVGLMVINHNDDGLLRVCALGGVDPRVLVSKRVHIGKDKLPGVIGAMAIHLQSADDRKNVLPIDQLYIDIGAKDKQDAERLVKRGEYVTFATPYSPFGDGLILAKALDDRVGVYNMLRILENEYPCDITCAFTCQEELGCRGAIGAAYRVAPDTAIALEGTTAADAGDTDESQMVCRVGGGVAVSFMDRASIARPDMFKELLAIAKENGIKHQIKGSVSGGNEAGSMQRAREGAKTIVLSVPCRYIHSPSTVCSKKDIDAQYALTKAYLERQ